MKPGLRVVRGPDWKWADQDGGEGHVGTVIKVYQDAGKVDVVWDRGNTATYRAGQNNAYDLHVFDNAQIGVIHPTVLCDACLEEKLQGLRWKCGVCVNYDLCSSCYSQDKHDLTHFFLRFDTISKTDSVKVPPRHGSHKCQAKGLFIGALVTRGLNWKWGDQDGGNGNKGSIIGIDNWGNCFRSEAKVLWSSGRSNTYRVGGDGCVDLTAIEPTFGGSYYKSHLPVLGKIIDGTSPKKEAEEVLTPLEQIAKSLQDILDTDMLKALINDDSSLLGTRVVRGPDWKWGDQDGGEGYVGTVCMPDGSEIPDKCVKVVWDKGNKNIYRIGQENSFDLRVLDSAPKGVLHKYITCDSCGVTPVKGIRWKCTSCLDFDLCSPCYHSDKHDMTHTFWRFQKSRKNRYKVPCRQGSAKIESRGIFQNAAVMRGQDWEWSDQDVGLTNTGLVIRMKTWSPKNIARSAAEVIWANGKKSNYRVGCLGKVDLKFVNAAPGGFYYRDHLPVLGKEEITACEFNVGDIVKCRYDAEIVMRLQQGHGGWNELMSKYVSKSGKVIEIDKDEDVVVKYDDGVKWCYNQDSLGKVSETITNTLNPTEMEAVKQVIELGYNKDVIENIAWRHFFEGNGYFTSAEMLLDKVEMMQKQSSSGRATSTIEEGGLYENQSTEALASGVADDDSSQPSSGKTDDNHKLAEENRLLREQRQCKICMDQEVSVTFVPCGHLVCCEECSSELSMCPMCRGQIKRVQRTFMS